MSDAVTLSRKVLLLFNFTPLQEVMITYSMTNILVKEPQEVFCLVICRLWILRTTCPYHCIDIIFSTAITWWKPSIFIVICIDMKHINHYFISINEPFPCLYWMKLTLKLLKQLLLEVCPSEQNLSFVVPSIIASQYDFPSTPRGNVTFLSIIWHKLLL